MESKRIRTDFLVYSNYQSKVTLEEQNQIRDWAQALLDDEVKFSTFSYEKTRYRQEINFFEDLFTPSWATNGVGIVILRVNDQLVGFYRVTMDEPDQTVGTITFVVIGPEFRRMGYGSILMNESRYLLQQRSIHTTQLCYDQNNKAACAFYEKLGYQIRNVQAAKEHV